MSVSTATGTAEVFEMGRVLRRTFGAIGRNAAIFLGLAALLAGIPQLISSGWQAEVGPINRGGAHAVTAAAVGTLLASLGVAILQVSVTRATISDLNGENPDFAACIKSGVRLLLPMIGLTIAATLGVGLASLALIVPGVILYVAWSVAVPVYVQERIGVFNSLSRSRALTKGARWKIFALLLVWWIVVVVLLVPAGMLIAVAHAPPLIGAFIQAIVSTFTTLVLTTMLAATYVELRDVKEGVPPQELETIFA